MKNPRFIKKHIYPSRAHTVHGGGSVLTPKNSPLRREARVFSRSRLKRCHVYSQNTLCRRFFSTFKLEK